MPFVQSALVRLRIGSRIGLVLFAHVLLCGCSEASDKVPLTSFLLPTALAAPASTPTFSAGTRMFFHLSQGSDFVPVCAIKLHLKEHGSPFASTVADYFAHFGLIPDPKPDDAYNPLGLPIGVTLSEGHSMAGFNCAACHVARIPDNPSGQI